MSTKIFTGFKFTTNDLTKIHHHIMDFRRELETKVEEKLIGYFARETSILLDAVAVGARKLKKDENVYGIIVRNYLEKTKEVREMKRHPEVDFLFNLSILPIEDGTVLGIVYCEQSDFINLWFDKPFIKDYAYWNNTDKPDELTDEEWEERENTWDKTLNDFGSIPSMLGYNADCVPQFIGPPRIDDIIKNFPPYEERLSRIAEDVLFEEQHKKEKIDINTAMRVYLDFTKFLKTPDGRLLKAKKEGVFNYKLKKDVVKEDLIK